LIHEATFEDGMEAEAALKRHSTVGEALTVARDMEAKCTILTHFSQRYPKIPPVPDSAHSFPVIFAFDYMRLKPSSLLAASQLIPALRLLFPEEEEEEGAAEASNVAEEAMSVPGVFAKSSLL
jgi:ribonuclease Z